MCIYVLELFLMCIAVTFSIKPEQVTNICALTVPNGVPCAYQAHR